MMKVTSIIDTLKSNKAILVALLLLVVTLMASPASAGTSADGMKWLAAKGAEEGVTTLPSGLMYKVLESSTNPAGKTPLVGTPCACHYAGTLIDGTEFDSSYKRGSPTTFAPNQVIKGWTEAMQLMKEGDTWELYLPSELAYGDRGAGRQIPGGAVLVFKLNLIEVKGPSKEL
jgi:FKBP-type peptidyl-prolyl cis-trans isomerase FklB